MQERREREGEVQERDERDEQQEKCRSGSAGREVEVKEHIGTHHFITQAFGPVSNPPHVKMGRMTMMRNTSPLCRANQLLARYTTDNTTDNSTENGAAMPVLAATSF